MFVVFYRGLRFGWTEKLRRDGRAIDLVRWNGQVIPSVHRQLGDWKDWQTKGLSGLEKGISLLRVRVASGCRARLCFKEESLPIKHLPVTLIVVCMYKAYAARRTESGVFRGLLFINLFMAL